MSTRGARTHRRRAHTLAGALGAALLLGAGTSAAKSPACAPTGPWVLATVKALPRGLALPDIVDRLGVELSSRGMSLCTAAPPSPSEPAVASVVFDRAAPSAAPTRTVSIDVEVRRGVRKKHASRELDLSTAPRDRGATVVALAADELMRAAAEELDLDAAPVRRGTSPAQGAPPMNAAEAGAPMAAGRAPGASADAPRRARAPAGPTVEDSTVALGARGGGELWTGGLSLLGGDGVLSLRPWKRARIDVLAGARAALERDTAEGSVRAHAFCARLGGATMLARPGGSAELWASTRLGAYAVRIETPSPSGMGATSDTATFGALVLELGPTLSVPLGDGSKALVIDMALAAAPIGAAAPRGDVGLEGLGVATSLGLVTGAL